MISKISRMGIIKNKYFSRLAQKRTHTPLIHKATPTLRTNIYNNVSNVYKFHFNFTVNNKLPKILAVQFLGNETLKLSNFAVRRNKIWLLDRSIVNTEYEFYLQKSMIKDIYNRYRDIENKIILFSDRLVQKLVVISNNTNIELKNRDYSFPSLIIKKNESAIDSATVNKIEKRENFQTSTINNSIQQNNISNSFQINDVVEQIYKNFEEKIRFEKLKKGY